MHDWFLCNVKWQKVCKFHERSCFVYYRWFDYSDFGNAIKDTNIIPIKTPLKKVSSNVLAVKFIEGLFVAQLF